MKVIFPLAVRWIAILTDSRSFPNAGYQDSAGKPVMGRGQRSRPWFSRGGETKSVSSYEHKILYITLFRNFKFFQHFS